jgi:hypothetical protein
MAAAAGCASDASSAGTVAPASAMGVSGTSSPRAVAGVPHRWGRLTGRFIAIGGPLGAAPVPQGGIVSLRQRSTGRRIIVAVGPDGSFDRALPPGRYAVSGHSPQFHINGREARCNARHPVVVRPRQVTHSTVYCERR